MIVFLLLVIVAILLFGSSVILGIFGAVLGFVALVLALFTGTALLASALGITMDDLFRHGIPILLAALVLIPLAVAILKVMLSGARLMRDRRDAARRKLLQEERQALFRAPASNRSAKKAMRRKAGF